MEKVELTVADCPHPFRFAFGYHPDALRAFEIQCIQAEANGQKWTEGHATAFRELHQSYVLTGLGITEGRTAWPLAVGTGKTQSIVALVKAQDERRRKGLPPISVLVCMERVAQLGKLYEAILEAGVSAEAVAIYHHKTPREVREEGLPPSVSEDQVSRKPFLLATHAMMLTGERGIAVVNSYEGRERGLVIWDESLQKAKSTHVDLARLEGSLGVLSPLVAHLGDAYRDAIDAHGFISEQVGRLKAELARQTAGGPPAVVEPARLEAGDAMRFAAGLSQILLRGEDALRHSAYGALSQFVRNCERSSRVLSYVEAGQRIGVIQYRTLIPASLQRLIILDASHNVRLLTSEHDQDVRVAKVDCAIKRFDRVAVRHLQQGAGRERLDTELPKGLRSSLVRDIVDELASYPDDEAVLVVTFKQSKSDEKRGKRSNAECLQQAMAEAGIDVAATLSSGLRRFTFITWGQHLGDSHHSHCRHVVCVGVLRRGRLDLSASIAGQRDDLLSQQAADAIEVHRVELSEVFHNLIQAAGRGTCRNTVDGQAGEMTFSFVCPDEFPPEWWALAMPGAKVSQWEPKHAKRAARRSEAADAILKALAGLPEVVAYVSCRTLKALSGLSSVASNRFSEAVQSIALQGAAGWAYSKTRRGFVRCAFPVRSP